ncbi:uncharacterized protein [Typha latifolia]|uniref:uncharacterized protein isoform X1 n=1 Tax=Typha latifolia TaxID=4733 RepID=UPI003C2E28D1
MCGIALIVSGVRILGFEPYSESRGNRGLPPNSKEANEPVFPIRELKASLLRRGPDNLGCRKVLLGSECETFVTNEGDEGVDNRDPLLRIQAVEIQDVSDMRTKYVAEMCFLGATLQLRGGVPISQPFVAVSQNILVYNGEVFGGVHVECDKNDAESLLYALERCCSCDFSRLDKACSCNENGRKSVPEVLSLIKGPWALIYWQEKTKTIWFGRDALGRRSLLVHWPTSDDSQFVLSSVSPTSLVRKDCGFNSSVNGFGGGEDPELLEITSKFCYWEELPCGIYSVHLKGLKTNEFSVKEEFFGEVRKHEWENPLLNKLIKWERTLLVPQVVKSYSHDEPLEQEGFLLTLSDSDRLHYSAADNHSDTYSSLTNTVVQSGYDQPKYKVLIAIRESVMRRTQTTLWGVREEALAPIALLFSGGLDSMILAALLDQCLNPKCTIDLLNVSFDGQHAPDRVSARAGVKELQRISPQRRWRLVEIDASLSNLEWEIDHVMTLLHPAKTYMDLNIGIALWLAAKGDGWVDDEICHLQEGCHRYRYKSMSKILLVGSGADEQCAGYGRHRTKYRLGGCIALHDEMRLDMQRIWKRNMGRDDRCISDHGKEARFPFLDEDVIRTLLEVPLWEIANLDDPVGRGDKKILREVAKLLGLHEAALLPKRAIQFGSRIARESNRKNFGSNRAANQASAGSAIIRGPT